jgi:hypothetical protein
VIFSNWYGTKSGGPLSWDTRLIEKVILGAGEQCKVQFFAAKQNGPIVYKSLDSSTKNIFYKLFKYGSMIPTPWRFE